MRKPILFRPGMGGIAVVAAVVLLLGSPAGAAYAGDGPQVMQTTGPNAAAAPDAAPREPVLGPTLGVRAVAGADDDGRTSDDPSAGDNPDASSETTPDERFAAAAVLGWTPRDELSMSDKDFVIVLWEKADDYFHPGVKQAAKDAFADVNDPGASARFIRTDIFAADKRDADLKAVRAQREADRLSAAQELNWIPADDDARRVMLRSTNANFLIALAGKAEAGSDVRKGAEALVDATEDKQLAFIATGVHQAAEADRARKIAEGKQKELEEQEAKKLRDIKQAAIVAGLGRVATEFELTQSTERDLVYKIKTETTGTQVKAAATTAYNSEKPADWRDFLATGVHVARSADIAERDRAEAAENERKVREILNDAKFDKYQPILAAAASKALEGDANARAQFLVDGKDKAAKLDVAQPAAYLTVALQGVRSKRCLQVAGAVDKPDAGANAENAPMEIGDCNENARERWILVPAGTGTYALQSVNSKKCLVVPAAKVREDVRLIQIACAVTTAVQQWALVDTGKDTVELRNVASNKVMTVPGSATALNSPVHQAANNHLPDQQWRLIDFSHHQLASPPLSGKFLFKGVQSGRCFYVSGATDKPDQGALADKAPVKIWTCNRNDPKHVWEVVPIGGNRFALKNQLKGKCLDILGGNAAKGGAMIQYACHLRSSEQWVLMNAGKSGSYMLRNALTGTYVDVYSQATADGSDTKSWPYTGIDNQRWIPQPY
ncbi:RICIN domain-containing protein [Actinoplanes sp. NPDC049316]|uniref:RICIN domain-containing protein n=1 Tax=Actinoplanes sp. NPDC049316 TaxID=3154727 RepID=UPI003441B36A